MHFKRLAVLLFAVLAAVSCVDSDYNLDETNLDVTLGGNGLVVPLSSTERVTMDSLLGSSLDELVVDENGIYAFRYGDTLDYTIEEITIEDIKNLSPSLDPVEVSLSEDEVGLPERIEAQGLSTSFGFDIPDYDFSDRISLPEIDEYQTVPIPSDFPQYSVPSGIELPLQMDNSVPLNVTIQYPEEVRSASVIEFGPDAEGAPIDLLFDLGKLASVNAGGRLVSARIIFPIGFELGLIDDLNGAASLSQGEGSPTRNVFTVSNYEAGATESIRVKCYLKSVDMTCYPEPQDGKVGISSSISYELSYLMTTKSGTLSSDEMPYVDMTVAPTFQDAVIETNPIDVEIDEINYDLNYDFDGIPTDISEVQTIAFLPEANHLTIRISDLGLPFDLSAFDVEMQLPADFHFESNPYLGPGNLLTAPLSVLTEGLQLGLDKIDFPEGSGVVSDEGVLSLREKLMVNFAHTLPSAVYRFSEIKGAIGHHQSEVQIDPLSLGVDASRSVFTVEGVSSMFETSDNIFQQIEIPEEVKRIDTLLIEALDGAQVWASLKVRIENSPVDSIYIDNFRLQLPRFLIIDDPDVNEDNELYFERKRVYAQSPDPVEIKEVRIAGISSGDIIDGILTLDEVFRLSGTVRVPDGTQIDGLDGNVKIYPVFSISDIRITGLEGLIDKDLDPYIDIPSIDLSNVIEEFNTDQDLLVNLSSPTIRLSFENPTGIGLKGSLLLQPYNMAGEMLDPVEIAGLELKAAKDGVSGETHLYITDQPNRAPADYKECYVPELSNLMRTIPSKIDVKLHVDMNPELEHFIEFGRTYDFNLKYDMHMPCVFGEDMDIRYSDTVKNLSGTFADLADMSLRVETLALLADVETTLPFNMEFSARFVDREGNEVENVVATTENQIAGYDPAVDAADSKTSEVRIAIDILDGDLRYLEQVEGVVFEIRATGACDQNAIRPDQYLRVNMRLTAEKGISGNLKDMFD